MKILAFLLSHKWLVSFFTILILTIAIVVFVNKRPPEQDQQQMQLTEEQQAKLDKFKSGKYQLSKPKTW